MQPRKPEGFNLAFLDIMACGLGAVVLVLVLLKNPEQANAAQEDSIESLKEVLSSLEIELESEEQLNQLSSEEEQNLVDNNQNQLSHLKNLIKDLEVDMAIRDQLKSQFDELKGRLQQQRDELKSKPKVVQKNKKKFLIGLEVKGKKIVVLLDISSSMTARKLLDISLYKAKGRTARASSKKWLRAKRVVEWILSNAPSDSKVKILAFNDSNRWVNTQWMQPSDGHAMADMINKVELLDPKKGTNLESAVSEAIRTNPDSIYIITDGLPTIGKKTDSFIPSDNCGGILKTNLVTGECRASLFLDVASVSSSFAGRISVVLLPLEGDPQAAPLFTQWALAHRGVMMSPPGEWP